MNNNLLNYLPIQVRQEIIKASIELDKINEIRMRVNKRLVIVTQNAIVPMRLVIDNRHINELIEFATKHSAYAYENQLRQGYLTIMGGHRIGICGKAIIKEGSMCGYKNISSVNIRVAHSIKGCSDEFMEEIRGEGKIKNVLIVSPPGLGKTTLLRDIIRNLAKECNVGVCDERGEIAAMYNGMINNDLGEYVDVIDGADKVAASEILLRTMSPRVIAMDEIGIGEEEIIRQIGKCGCSIIATIHGEDYRELRTKEEFRDLLSFFQVIITLYNDNGRRYVINNNSVESL